MYKPIKINQIRIPTGLFDQRVITNLEGLRSIMGIKGGFAREIYKVATGISVICPLEKMNDVDVAVFEDQKEKRNDRIATREFYSQVMPSVHPKDMEFISAGLMGLKHYFLTRDVTMSEIVVFMEGHYFLIYFTDQAACDIRDRIIRPSVHCAHSGLGQVWTVVNGKKVIHPNITRRCLYRKIKGDGDVYDFEPFNTFDSISLFDEDALYKTVKRFISLPDLLEKSALDLINFGFSEKLVQKVMDRCRSGNSVTKPEFTSKEVEDVLDRTKEDHEKWLSQHCEEIFRRTADVLIG